MNVALDANHSTQQRRKTQTQKDFMKGKHLDRGERFARTDAILLFRA
jgi:hypothetical protein